MKRAILVMILVSMMLVACGDSVTGPAQATETLTLPTDDYQIYLPGWVYRLPQMVTVYNSGVQVLKVTIYCDDEMVAYTQLIYREKSQRLIVDKDAWKKADKNGNWVISISQSGYTQSKRLRWGY